MVGYEIGRQLSTETIFSERLDGKMILRRGFQIPENSNVLIVEDVITTGKSALECSEIVKKYKSKTIGYACIIDRSNIKTLKIKKNKIISQLKINVPVFNKKKLPLTLKKIPITRPGSRHL